MISVIIATKDRPEKLYECLGSILRNTHSDYEIIVIDQSKNDLSKKTVYALSSEKITYVKQAIPGKSKAINKGLTLTKGEIVAFTDDDCVVSNNWLSEIELYFSKHPLVMGVFGKTLPYQPKEHPHAICPALFYKPTETTTSDPKDLFCISLGQGNNVSYRKKMFQSLGNMNESFGPGAEIPTAEDVEILYRALIHHKVLAYTPTAVVFHNRWISPEEERQLLLTYTLGVCAAAIYCALHFHDLNVLHLLGYKFKENVTSKMNLVLDKSERYFMLLQIKAIIRGVYVGMLVASKR